jgi:Carboxypeptidase regulatory-like domain
MLSSTVRTTVLLTLSICLLPPVRLGAQATNTTTTHLQGTVLSGTPDQPLYAAGAEVTLYGDTGIFSTVTDQNGRFAFINVGTPETYFIEATYHDLHAQKNVVVHAGAVAQVSLHLEAPNLNISAKP